MVIITDEMKQSVNNDSIHFIIKSGLVKRRIIQNGINADKKVSGNNIIDTIIKSDDISEIIMRKIFLIDIKKIIVRTENDIDIPNCSGFTIGNTLKPSASCQFVLELEISLFGKKSDHIENFDKYKQTNSVIKRCFESEEIKKLEIKYIISTFEGH